MNDPALWFKIIHTFIGMVVGTIWYLISGIW